MKAFVLDSSLQLISYKVERALFGCISNDGGTWSIDYASEGSTTGRSLSGYSGEVFNGLPGETPVIDYRGADEAKVMKLIMKIDGIEERDDRKGMYYLKVADYLRVVKTTGATITTVEEVRRADREASALSDDQRHHLKTWGNRGYIGEGGKLGIYH